jgi:Tol biopolymer transport system component
MRDHLVRVLLLAGITATAVAVLDAQQPPSPEELLGKGLHQEQVQGDCKAAIATYKTVSEDPRVKQATAGRALLQLAGCYERLGRPEARATYQRVLQTAAAGSPAYSAAEAKLPAAQAPQEDKLAGKNIDAYFKDATLVTPSPRGTLVAYTRPKPGRFTLILGEQRPISLVCVRDLGTGQERVLYDPQDKLEIINRIAWSPDNASIAYTVQLDSNAFPVKDGWAFALRVVTVATGQIRSVVHDQPARMWFLQWAPDSGSLAFESHENANGPRRVVIWNRATNTTRTVGTIPTGMQQTVTWSPDSLRIAFVRDGSKDSELIITSRTTEDQTTLRVPPPPAGAQFRLGAWNVNGEIGVMHQIPQVGNDYYMVPVDGRAYRKICEGRGTSGGDGCQATDAFNSFQVVRRNTTEGGRTLLRDLATGVEKTLTDAAVMEQPILLPSQGGKLIAFRSDREGDFGVYVAPVDQLPVRNPVRIARLDSATSTAFGWWTTDGLVLNISRPDANIYRVNIDPATGKPTGGPQRLTHSAPNSRNPSISPDGRRIAYVMRNRESGIALMDANGSNERLLTAIPSDLLNSVGQIGWRSPNQLLLHAGRTAGRARFYVVDIPTGVRQALSPQPDLQGGGLEYVAETDEVLYGHDGRGSWEEGREQWARSMKTGIDRFVRKDPPRTSSDQLSSDGSTLFYSTFDDKVPDGKPVRAEIRMRTLATGEEKVLATYANANIADYVITITMHGKFLLYQDPDRVQRIMNVETLESWPLLNEPLAGVDLYGFGSKWAPDGSYILFMGDSRRIERRQWTGLTYDAVTKLIRR